MSEGRLYHADYRGEAASPAAIRDALDALPEAAGRWLYLESETAVKLLRFDGAEALGDQPAQFPVGRVFGENCELRWEWIAPGVLAIQVLAERDLALPAAFEAERFDVQDDEARVRLWGLYDKDADADVWTETRIPRALAYPVPADEDKRAVAVDVVHYRRGGMVRATRWKRMHNLEEGV